MTMALRRARMLLAHRRVYYAAWILLVVAVCALFVIPRFVAGMFVVVVLLSIYQRRVIMIASLLMVAVLVAGLFLALRLTTVDYKRAVRSPPPDYFPVLVVLKNAQRHLEPHVVYYRELEELKRRFPESSFAVPNALISDMQKALSNQSKAARVSDAEGWAPRFSVSAAGPNRQRFEVSGSADDDVMNRSWYVVDGGRILPEQYENYGRAQEADSFVAVIIVSLSWLLITPFVLYYVNSRFTPVNGAAELLSHP
jgi:hypothetical protein